MASYKNCGTKLSREHYAPESVLKTMEPFGSKFVMGGVPWLGDNEERQMTRNNVVARCLCTRHNTAFSPLDEEIVRLAKAVSPMEGVEPYPIVGGRSLVAFNAGDVERAILRMGAGMWSGGTAPAQDGHAVAGTVPSGWLQVIAGERSLRSTLGLRVRSRPGDLLRGGEVEVGLVEVGGEVYGSRFAIHGLEILVLTRVDRPPGVEHWLERSCEFGFPVELSIDMPSGPRLLYFGGRGRSAATGHRTRRRSGSLRRP